MPELAPEAIDQLFLQARTHNGWQDRPVSDELLHRLYDVMRMGPTAANATPMRVVFVKSREAREKLKPALAPGNVDKTMQAPVTAIIAFDLAFAEQMPRLFPARDMKTGMLAMSPEARREWALTNSALQGAYLMLTARAMGLDCGPMGGFDKAQVDEAFLAGTEWKSLFLVNLGYGDASKLYPRNPRLAFEEAARIV